MRPVCKKGYNEKKSLTGKILDKEKRQGQPAIPDNLQRYLNENQMHALENVERFGCTLKFVRRPALKKAIPVLLGPDGKKMGVLEESGNIEWEPALEFRN